MNRRHDKGRRDRLFIVDRDLRDDAGDRFDLSRARVAARRAIREAITLRVNFNVLDHLRLIKNVLVGGTHLWFVLRGAIKAVQRSFFLFALQVRSSRIANCVFSFTLNALFRFFPHANPRFIRTKDFSLLPFVLKCFVRKVGKGGCRVLVLVGGFGRFLNDVSVQGTCRSTGATCAVVCVCRGIAQLGLTRLFWNRYRLATAHLIAAGVMFVRAVGGLVIYGGTTFRCVVYGTLVWDLISQGRHGVVTALLGSVFRALYLLLAVNACVWNMASFLVVDR